MIRILSLALVGLTLAPSLSAEETHLSERDGLRVQHAWGISGRDGLRVFLEIQNKGSTEVVLSGGATADGTGIKVMATLPGTDQAEAIGEIPIAAGADMDFEPGGLYLWINPAPDAVPGDLVAAHLDFAPLGELDVEIEIFPDGTRQHPHAGHNH